jgi:hypothetical protein
MRVRKVSYTYLYSFLYDRGGHNAACEPLASHVRYCYGSLKIAVIIFGTKC